MTPKWLLVVGGAFAATAVAFGAFAAHGLKAQLSPYLLGVFETGVQYQFYHAFAVIIMALASYTNLPAQSKKRFLQAALCFIIGVFCFSGSLYALALTGIKWFGPITPIGGVSFIIGWLVMISGTLAINRNSQ